MKLKEIKKNAHKNVKTHYATYLVLCLAAVLMGSEFSSTLSLLKQDNAKSVSGLLMHSSFVKSMTSLLPEGAFVKTLFLGLSTIVHSKDIASICFVVIGLCISVFYRVYIVNVLPVINRRLFLEGRVYAKLPLDRLVYLMRIRKQMHVALVKLVKSIILTIMNFTVVGGVYFYHPLKSNPFLMHTKHGNNQNPPVFLTYNMPYAYLNTIEAYKKSNLRVLHPNRNYTVTSILVCFFFMCFVGWIWEVSLSMISYGRFVNRGVLHGPWIPIYGFGCILILLLLKRFRIRPKVEFSMAVLLCGCIEYFTGLVLELTHNGQKWWDYTGYFLNLHGRICAEGLLVFGVGGMAFVYVIAPLIDNWVKEHLNKRLSTACLVLLLLFGADVVYSHFEPNVGEGVTG
jgi:hypothetical protein